MATKLPLMLGTMSYPTLFKAEVQGKPGQKTGDPKFSVNILIPKGDPQIAVIQAAIAAEVLTGLNNVQPATDKVCLKDCLSQYPDQAAIHGFMELRCNSGESNKPHTIDMDRQPILDTSLVFGGAEAYFSVNISSYTTGSNGVGAYINGVMLTGKEGPLGRLDNKEAPDTMFAQAPGAGGVAPTAPGAAPVAHQMTALAAGSTYEAMIGVGWDDAKLIAGGYMLAPAPAAPTPPTPAPAPSVAVAPQMTALAAGGTYEAFIAQGWDDAGLIAGGYMLAPAPVAPAAPTPPAPAAPTPPAPTPPAPAPAAAAVHQMTALAAGGTYEAFIAQGWDDAGLIAGGYMLSPGGVPTAF